MSTINLTNAEVLDFSQTANYIDGGNIYQYGRTVNLGITAFIYPGKNIESTNFSKIDKGERDHLDEILSTGFVESISINGQIIQNVKIISYDFPTNAGSLDNHINLSRVNMALEFYEAFDHTKNLKAADTDTYKDTSSFLKVEFSRYFQSFSENFTFSINDSYQHNFTQSINFNLRQDTHIDTTDLVIKAKELALQAFNLTGSAMAKVGYIDSRYADFARTVKGNGIFSESFDSINNSYSISRNIRSKNLAYKDTQKGENWSSEFSHSIALTGDGSVSITESGVIQGRSVEDMGEDADQNTNKGEDTYENAYQGLVATIEGTPSAAYTRCQATFTNFIKNPPSWVPGDLEWNNAADLKEKYVSFGREINRLGGQISYTLIYTNNPRMHNDGIFEYNVQAQRQTNNITNVTESGTMRPYDESKWEDFDPKTLYDKFTSSDDVLARIKPLYESVRVDSSTSNLTHPKNLISSNISFPAYGVEVSYSFTYSDDPTLRNETYVRKLDKTSDSKMPVAFRSSVVAPNVKETNYDSNQTQEGSKNVTMNCIFKRNPNSNLINPAHTNYLKTAADSVVSSLKNESQTSAFITAKQNAKDELSWYLTNMSYSFNSDYTLNYSIDMNFVDKKGFPAEVLEY